MSELRDDAHELDTRAWNGLISLIGGNEDAITPKIVASFRAADYMRITGVGAKSIKAVRAWLGRHGLAFRDETPVRADGSSEPPLLLQVRKVLEEHGRLTWELKVKTAEATFLKQRLNNLEKRRETERALWDARFRDLAGRHNAELQRLNEGPKHIVPAANALQRALLEMANDLATGRTTLQGFEALLAENFDKYRAWAGVPKTYVVASDIEKQILATGGAL